MSFRRRNTRAWALLLAAALVVAVLGAALLHADDAAGHRECAACRWAASTHAVLAPVPSLGDAHDAVVHRFAAPPRPRSEATSREVPARGPPLS